MNLCKPFRSFFASRCGQIIGGILFVLGTLLGFAFNSLAVIADLNAAGFWGDYRDALEFDREKPTQADLVRIRCPIFMSLEEERIIRADFRNSNREKVNILVKAVVSQNDYNQYRIVTNPLSIDASDNRDFGWQITSSDIVGRYFILNRVFLMNQDHYPPYPARTESCGIIVVDLFGLNGNALVGFMLAASLVCLGIGGAFLYFGDSPIKKSSPRIDTGLYGLVGVLAAGMAANLLGWWICAGMVLLLAVLLTSIIVPNLFLSKA